MTPLKMLGVIVIVTVAMVTSSVILVSADLPPDARPCYDYLCRCSEDGTVADCSDNGNRLTFIPKLMSWVTDVNLFYFSYNQLINVTDETVKNISHYHITYLRLRSNKIRHIAPHAFDQLKNLATLDLSDNPVSLPELSATFYHMPTTLAYLYLDGLNINDSVMEASLLKGLERSSVTGIHLARNHLTTFNFSFFTGFSELVTLSLEENNISTVFISGYTSNTLSTLWLGHNNITSIPDYCYEAEHYRPSFPSLYTLDMEFNQIQIIDAISVRCLKNLRHLYLSGNPIDKIQTKTFETLENLQLLNISQNTAELTIDTYAFNNSQLKMLNLSNSRIKYFIDVALPKKNCNLQTLDLSGNHIFRKWNPEFSVLLKACHDIRYFYCNNCSLTGIPTVISSFRNLEGLFLNDNNIETIRKHMFDHNHGLRKLYLSHNNISTVQGDAISNSVRSALTNASLEYNPFVCSCDILWLRNWLIRARSLFSEHLAHYKCAYPGHQTKERIVDDPAITNDACFDDSNHLYKALCAVGTVFVCILCFALGYKFRWRIRYRLKWTKPSRHFSELQPLLTNDVYILYSDDDYTWVRYKALPNLEEKGRLKVCFRQRDFNPKVHMVDSIANNLQHSRKVLFVLSNNFFKDSASQFELSLVQKHLEDIHEALVVVLLEDIDNRYMSHDLYRLMKDREHIKWTATEDNADMAWRSLLCQIKGMTEFI